MGAVLPLDLGQVELAAAAVLGKNIVTFSSHKDGGHIRTKTSLTRSAPLLAVMLCQGSNQGFPGKGRSSAGLRMLSMQKFSDLIPGIVS